MSEPRSLPSTARGVTLLGTPVHYVRAGTEALGELEPEHLAAHRRRLGSRPDLRGRPGAAFLDRLDDTSLTGRGGGHYPTAAKWRRVLAARAAHPDGPIVVANGAEGEPLSRKDAALLEFRPHLVLDGLACAAEVLGAGEAVLWLHKDAHAARAAVTRALAERSTHHPDDPPIRVALGPNHYLTGESSTLVNALSGRPARPSLARVPAAQSGVDGRPTLVQNVETLARAAVLARGLAADSVLLTMATDRHLVVGEFADHRTLAAAVTSTLGAPVPQAVLMGGYGGRWLPWDATHTPLRSYLHRTAATTLGAGVVAILPDGTCGLERTATIAAYLADSSARQCGPCRFGLPAVAELAADLADTRARRRDARRLERFLAEVSGRGACHHPDGAVRLVASALEVFAEDVEAHLRRRCMHRPSRRGRRG